MVLVEDLCTYYLTGTDRQWQLKTKKGSWGMQKLLKQDLMH